MDELRRRRRSRRSGDRLQELPLLRPAGQRQLSKKLTLGTELFGHGAEGPAATSTRAATLLDLGGIYEFKPGFDLLFAAGRSVFGQPETYTYLSLYWTWGPGGAGDQGDPAQPGSGTGSKMLSALTRLRLRQ